jgi:threonylcarbamoyladenosine tRNA methylthiotransferase MtaB
MQRAYFENNVGAVRMVLAEQPTGEGGFVEGLTDNYIRVEVAGDSSLCGNIIPVEITEASIDKCKGSIL